MDETDLTWHEQSISSDARRELMGHRGCVVWFTGLSGSGKSTVANLVDLLPTCLGLMGMCSFASISPQIGPQRCLPWCGYMAAAMS